MKMKTFILHWLSGETEEVKGETIAIAFAMAGYGAVALGALDYYEEKKETKKRNNDESKI